MNELGIHTIGDLATADEKMIKLSLGKNGERLRKRANGIDYRPVDPEAAEERKSVGSSTTLPIDETELDECLKTFKWLANKVALRLDREQLAGTVIMIQIRTADWKNQSRSRTVLNPLYKENEIYKIIDGNKPFPTAEVFNYCNYICPINNIKVINIVTGKIYYCSPINLISIQHGFNEEGKPEVVYNGTKLSIDQVFKNPYPFL